MNWTKEQARRYLIHYQFLHKQATSIEQVFQRLHTIQYDPLNVVGTNPNLVLQARIPSFTSDDLDRELYQNRSLVDGWDKQMSIYRTIDFPLLEPLRNARSEMELAGLRNYLDMDIEPYIEDVLYIVRSDGPIFSRDIKFGESLSHRWGRTKPSSATIDYLFHRGILGVHSRQRSQKKYDLIERLISVGTPEDSLKGTLSFEEWYLLRRVRNAGLCWNKSSDLYGGLHLRKKSDRAVLFHRLVEQGAITPVAIEGLSDVCYVPSDHPNCFDDVPDRMTFLAPLDNLNWDRALLEELFEFHYRWEVYTPANKRQYGYYVLPILYRDQMVGRIEFDHFRGGDLTIKNIWWEPDVDPISLRPYLKQALSEFCQYLGADQVIDLS